MQVQPLSRPVFLAPQSKGIMGTLSIVIEKEKQSGNEEMLPSMALGWLMKLIIKYQAFCEDRVYF